MKAIKELFQTLQTPQTCVIITHEKPDGDALGSSLGLYHYLRLLGHKVVVISPTNWPSFLHWLPSANKMLISYEKHKESADKWLDRCTLLFCLDLNNINRARSIEPKVSSIACTKILIDHHPSPHTEQFHFGISEEAKSSTCEMVYDLICAMGNESMINKDIATCLYTGIMTDTGGFKYRNTTAEVHRTIAKLIEKGVEHFKIYQNVFESFSESRMRFLGYLLKDKMQIHPSLPIGLITVSKEDIKQYKIENGDTEGIVFLPLSIKNIMFSALFSEKEDGTIRASFRSQNSTSINVNAFARKYFNGGGHFNAAGGSSTMSLEETIKTFWESCEEFFHSSENLKTLTTLARK